jgi:photosystem II stability/assembly factor-like uncharacterized protein
VQTPVSLPLLGLCVTGGGVVAVGSAGTIVLSSDGGASWSETARSHRSDINDICFVSPTEAYVVDGRGAILRYHDRQRSWDTLRQAGDILFAVSFADDKHGLAAGDRGAVLATSDGGANWTAGSALTPNTLWDIAWLSPSEAVITSCCGSFFLTTDGGGHWETLTITPKQRYYAVSFPDPGYGIAVGTEGAIVRSTDRGRSWQEIPTGITADLHAVQAISRDVIVAAGENGLVIRSSDGGEHWAFAAQLGHDLWALQFTDARNGICAGTNGLLAWTRDGGVTWTSQTPITDLSFFCAASTGEGDVYAGGRAGLLLRAHLEAPNATADIPAAPRGIRLISTHPLPARDRTTLRYHTERPSAPVLRLYDSIGRLVLRRDLRYESAGTRECTVRLEDLPSGMYRIVLTSGNEITAGSLPVVR